MYGNITVSAFWVKIRKRNYSPGPTVRYKFQYEDLLFLYDVGGLVNGSKQINSSGILLAEEGAVSQSN